jgi:hypothetical protein
MDKKTTAVLNFLNKFTGGAWPDIDELVESFAPDSRAYPASSI